MTKSDLSQIARYNIRKAKPTPTLDKTTLLVIDMQKYFGSVAKSILEKVISLIAICRRQGIKVLYTIYGRRRENDGSMLSKWWGEQIFYGEFDGRRRKRVLVKIMGE